MIRLVSAFAFRLGWVRIAWVVVGAENLRYLEICVARRRRLGHVNDAGRAVWFGWRAMISGLRD